MARFKLGDLIRRLRGTPEVATTAEVAIGAGGAFMRFRRATEKDVEDFRVWLAIQKAELREIIVPIPDDFNAQARLASIRATLLWQLAGDLLVGLFGEFRQDQAVQSLLSVSNVPINLETARPRDILNALLTFPAIAGLVERATGVPLDGAMDFLMSPSQPKAS
jgi:hypothetical protein